MPPALIVRLVIDSSSWRELRLDILWLWSKLEGTRFGLRLKGSLFRLLGTAVGALGGMPVLSLVFLLIGFSCIMKIFLPRYLLKISGPTVLLRALADNLG